MGEDNKAMTVYIDGRPIPALGNLPEITEVPTSDLPDAFYGGMAGAGIYAGFALSAAAESFSRAAAAILEAFQRITDAMAPTIREIAEWLAAVHRAEALFNEALEAAKVGRPKWVTIYRRTKKGRIRKKYRDRILRWYLSENGGGQE